MMFNGDCLDVTLMGMFDLDDSLGVCIRFFFKLWFDGELMVIGLYLWELNFMVTYGTLGYLASKVLVSEGFVVIHDGLMLACILNHKATEHQFQSLKLRPQYSAWHKCYVDFHQMFRAHET